MAGAPSSSIVIDEGGVWVVDSAAMATLPKSVPTAAGSYERGRPRHVAEAVAVQQPARLNQCPLAPAPKGASHRRQAAAQLASGLLRVGSRDKGHTPPVEDARMPAEGVGTSRCGEGSTSGLAPPLTRHRKQARPVTNLRQPRCLCAGPGSRRRAPDLWSDPGSGSALAIDQIPGPDPGGTWLAPSEVAAS